MDDTFWNSESLVCSQMHRFGALNVEEYLAIEYEEEFVLIRVLVPRELALENAEAYDRVIDGREGLVEPRDIRRRLGRYVDNR